MVSKPKTNSRVFDGVVLSILACLFAKGYLIALQPKLNDVYLAEQLFYGSYLEIAALSLVSFLSAFYAFRVHTRVLWVVGAPLIVAAMPVFGANVFERLNHAPGEERFVMMRDPSGLLTGYLGFLLCWSVVRLMGLRLRAKADSVVRSQLSLQELMAVTAVVAALLFSCRHSVSTSRLQWGDVIGRMHEERLRILFSIFGLFSLFGGLILGCLLCRRRWIATSLLFSITGFCGLVWLHLTTTRRWYSSYNGMVPLVAWFVIFVALPLIVVVAACGIARDNGYRLARRNEVLGDVFESPQDSDLNEIA